MARNLTAAVETELDAANVRPILLVEFDFPSGMARFWTGIGDFVWNGQTFTGAGDLLDIGPVEETDEVRATEAEFTLAGLASDRVNLDRALAENYQQRPARMWLAFLAANGQVVADPIQVFDGRMDRMPIVEDGSTTTIKLVAESELVALGRARDRRYTPEDQKIAFPSDKGLDFVPTIQNREIRWPR